MSKNTLWTGSEDIAEYVEKNRVAEKQHEVLKSITQRKLHDILTTTKHLQDISGDVTLEEVNAQISLIRGQSIILFVTREALPPFEIVVPQSGTSVRDLKKAIERYYTLTQRRQQSSLGGECSKRGGQTKISWRYIWRTYMLAYGGIRLVDDNQVLATYGIQNKDHLRFVKRKRDKCSKKH
ncbi:hypothetical protein DMENIID0001_086300 [Sergentomyia squamirostris]